MTGSLGSLAIALALFIGIHQVPGVPGLRKALQGAEGKRVYRAVFSLSAIGGPGVDRLRPYGCALYRALGSARLDPAGPACGSMPLVLMLLAGMPRPAMRKVTRHPMLWAVFLWAAAHIPANGDAASVMLFGSLILFALIDQPLADARIRREEPER